MLHDTCSAFSVSVCGSEEAVVLQLWDLLGVLLTNCQEYSRCCTLNLMIIRLCFSDGDHFTPLVNLTDI